MSYLCVTKNGIDGDVLCIGNNNGQSGTVYLNLGIWCSFTFDDIPIIPPEIMNFIQDNNFSYNPLKVKNITISVKSLDELTKEKEA